MTRLFENDDVILEKNENNEYRLSFFKDGHSKSEEHYPSYNLTTWANRLPDCDVFSIDWETPQGWGRVEFVMPNEGGRPHPSYRRNGTRLCQRALESIC